MNTKRTQMSERFLAAVLAVLPLVAALATTAPQGYWR